MCVNYINLIIITTIQIISAFQSASNPLCFIFIYGISALCRAHSFCTVPCTLHIWHGFRD